MQRLKHQRHPSTVSVHHSHRYYWHMGADGPGGRLLFHHPNGMQGKQGDDSSLKQVTAAAIGNTATLCNSFAHIVSSRHTAHREGPFDTT